MSHVVRSEPEFADLGRTHGVRGNVTLLFHWATVNGTGTEGSTHAKRLVGYEVLLMWKVGS